MTEMEKIIPGLDNYWKRIQTFLGLSYLLMIATGMLFNYTKYSEFGINIFQYADIFDFFIAPFEDRVIMIFAFVTIISCLLMSVLDTFIRNKSERIYTLVHFGLNKKTWFNRYLYTTFVLLLIMYMYLAAGIYGKQTEKKIMNSSSVTLVYSDNQKIIGKQIGKTKEVIFLLDEKFVTAVPITSLVKEIKIREIIL